MKKVLALLLVMVFALTLGACNGDDPIADLQEQLDALQSTITALESDIEDLEGDLSALESTLSALQAAHTALEAAMGEDKAALEAEIAELEQALVLVGLQIRAALGHVDVHHGVGYDLVHGHYVGIAHVTVAEGVIIGATVDEYFLPYSWGNIGAIGEQEEPAADQFFVRGTRNRNNIYAKYLVIAGYECVGHVEGEAGSQSPKYMCDIDGVDVEIEDWVAEAEANAKAYAESFDGFTTWAESTYNYIADENFDRHDSYEVADASASVHILKSIAPYWRFGALGWLGNARATEAAVLGMSLTGDETLVRGEEDNLWSVDDAVTGATWSDFPDYFETLVRAYNNAIAE